MLKETHEGSNGSFLLSSRLIEPEVNGPKCMTTHLDRGLIGPETNGFQTGSLYHGPIRLHSTWLISRGP